jgi:hypothetical protein
MDIDINETTPRFGQELGRHLKQLLHSHRLTDFTIPIQRIQTIPLHRFILIVRCPNLLSIPNLFDNENLSMEEAMQVLELIYTNKTSHHKKVLLNKKIWRVAKYLEKDQINFLKQYLKRYAFKGKISFLNAYAHTFSHLFYVLHCTY